MYLKWFEVNKNRRNKLKNAKYVYHNKMNKKILWLIPVSVEVLASSCMLDVLAVV